MVRLTIEKATGRAVRIPGFLTGKHTSCIVGSIYGIGFIHGGFGIHERHPFQLEE